MQDILAISIAAVAAGYLARQAWLRFSRKQGGVCSSCPSCSSNDSIKSRPLITISTDISHAKAQRR
jgi:hypothetical protein